MGEKKVSCALRSKLGSSAIFMEIKVIDCGMRALNVRWHIVSTKIDGEPIKLINMSRKIAEAQGEINVAFKRLKYSIEQNQMSMTVRG